MTDAERAADDPDDFADAAVGMRQLIVRGIDLRAGGTYSVTYEDVMVQDTAKEGVEFKIEFRGNSGPGVVFGAVGVPVDETGAAIDADAQKVDVLDVVTWLRHGCSKRAGRRYRRFDCLRHHHYLHC